MKKVLLVLTLGFSMVALSSCIGRDCVCKVTAKDGDRKVVEKVSVYDNDVDKDKCTDAEDMYKLQYVEYNDVKVKCR
ncbi:MAG: hypothetical protein J6X18_06175 [Bacteroidales bacterium]|nr:hypothetical protein [Bacteroidales bacterium]